MTDTIDLPDVSAYIRNGILLEEQTIPSLLTSPVPQIGGDPASNGPCGVADVEGNIAFFNCLEVGVGLKVPLGAGSIPSAFAIATDGVMHPVTSMVTQGNPPFTIPVTNGMFWPPLTGSYMMNLNCVFAITGPSANFFITLYLTTNSPQTVVIANNFSFPAAQTTVQITLNTLLYVFPGQVGQANGGSYGLGVSCTGATGCSLSSLDAQFDYIGSNPKG